MPGTIIPPDPWGAKLTYPTAVAGQATYVFPDPAWAAADISAVNLGNSFFAQLSTTTPADARWIIFQFAVGLDYNPATNVRAELRLARVAAAPSVESFTVVRREYATPPDASGSWSYTTYIRQDTLYTGGVHLSTMPGENIGDTFNLDTHSDDVFIRVERHLQGYYYLIYVLDYGPTFISFITAASVTTAVTIETTPPPTVSVPGVPAAEATCIAQLREPGWRIDWPQRNRYPDVFIRNQLGAMVDVSLTFPSAAGPRAFMANRNMILTGIEHHIQVGPNAPGTQHRVEYRLERRPDEDLAGQPFYGIYDTSLYDSARYA